MENTYKAVFDGRLPEARGSVHWESPANIALIKYWGKRPVQLPMNPSLSFVLRKSVVGIRMHYHTGSGKGFRLNSFSLNGQEKQAFAGRIEQYLGGLQAFFPFLQDAQIHIESHSSFPHSAGIASSAAAFSALALCVGTMEAELMGAKVGGPDFFRKASFMARLGSGSACRSLWDGLVCWGKTDLVEGSSDEQAVRLQDHLVHESFRSLNDAILVVDSKTKKVSSSDGHALMQKHPYRQERIKQSHGNLQLLLEALQTGDLELFGQVVENEALSLHSLMMSSNPGYVLMHPNTLLILEKIRHFRLRSKIPACFTLDAGPNIHLLYPAAREEEVRAFIRRELSPLCEDGRWIDDGMGTGPGHSPAS